MRIAVCVSGRCISKRPNGSLNICNNILKRAFPTADFYYATWDGYKENFKKAFPNDECLFFPEPGRPYHPYHDIDKRDHISEHYIETTNWVNKGGSGRTEYTSHHLKQILIHSWLSDTIKDNYDVIVRTRWDQFVSSVAEFTLYTEDTHREQRANCFGTTRQHAFNELFEVDKEQNPLHQAWLLDHIIIHPANAIDNNHVNQLYKDKKLHAAEFGWYQIISMLHGSRHRNHSGWVNPDWTILDHFYKSTLSDLSINT